VQEVISCLRSGGGQPFC